MPGPPLRAVSPATKVGRQVLLGPGVNRRVHLQAQVCGSNPDSPERQAVPRLSPPSLSVLEALA